MYESALQIGKKRVPAAYPVRKREVCRLSIWIRKRRARAQSAREKRERTARRPRPVLGALALPDDVAENGVRLIVMGCGRALVENHLGVADIAREYVRLVTRDGILTLRGEELLLTDVREGALSISGRIEHIELPHGIREGAARGD